MVVSGSILHQAVISTTPGVQTLAAITGLMVLVYIVYQVAINKNREVAKLVVGLQGLAPAIILAIMAFLPATIMAVFGPAEALVTALFTVFIAAFAGYVLAWMGLHIYNWLKPGTLPID